MKSSTSIRRAGERFSSFSSMCRAAGDAMMDSPVGAHTVGSASFSATSMVSARFFAALIEGVISPRS